MKQPGLWMLSDHVTADPELTIRTRLIAMILGAIKHGESLLEDSRYQVHQSGVQESKRLFAEASEIVAQLRNTSPALDDFLEQWEEAFSRILAAQAWLGIGIGIRGVRQARARRAAEKKHANSPTQNAKKLAKEWWEEWQRDSTMYESQAAFARAMLDKYPNELTSQPVVEGWCRQWKNIKP